MAKYIKKEMADMAGTGSTKAYYRMKTEHKMEFDEFLIECSKSNRLYTPSVIQGAVMAVCSELAYQLSRGNTVRIEGLGMFNAKIGIREHSGKKMDSFDDETRRNAMSLGVTGVGYKADKELIRAVSRTCTLERGRDDRLRKSKYTKEERIELAKQFLRREGFMHIKDYAEITGLSRTTAYRELNSITNASTGITSRGSKSAKIYFLKPEGNSSQ